MPLYHIVRLIPTLLMVCATASLLHADLVSPITAYEAADERGACHWMVDLKDQFSAQDSVQIGIVDAKGKQVWGKNLPASWIKRPRTVDVFCWENKKSGAMVLVVDAGGMICTWQIHDYLAGFSTWGPGNNSMLSSGDILLKFDPSKSPRFSSDNNLDDAQLGLRLALLKK